MLVLNGGGVLQLVNLMYVTEFVLRGKSGSLSTIDNPLNDGVDVIIDLCGKLGLPVTAATADNMLRGKNDIEAVHRAMTQLLNNFHLEMKDRNFYGPMAEYQKYHDNQKLFGDDVFDRFSSANNDLYEAGMCLAFERPTACVMHLMKVLEAGLAVLARDLGVPPQNDWGSYIREIEKELQARIKGLKARSGDEQFYAEAGAGFDYMRRAYRNPTMHPDRSYSQQRAEEILLAIKSFMIHLATKLRE
jgi:hypothetical protein